MTPAKILVVDDEPDLELLVRQKFRRRIRDGDYQFLFAGDGEEALAALAAEPDVDIVLSDINMPRMDGLTLLDRLRDTPGTLRALIVSAYGDMKNIRTAMNRGAFDFITKPIDFDDLEITLSKTLADLNALRDAEERRAKAERARTNLARYFSPNLARHLAEHPDTLELRGERRDLTFLFTDLADFTPLAETLDPAIIVEVMNAYIGGLSRIVFAHGGTIDTVVGDAIHAMFGAPVEQPDHAARAVDCALDLDRFAEDFAALNQAAGLPIGHTRIGVHSGPATVGNFGGDAFFHYTAHGDAINTAARLENANKRLGTRVCVSADTVAAIPGFAGRPIGTLVLKGKDTVIKAFEPVCGDAMASDAAAAYLAAFAQLEAGDAGAMQSFAALVGRDGQDPLARFHLKRLLAGDTGTRIVLADAT
ncbi:MAG: response regulator [Rhodospirillales bacterium]|nr:response regulator [Rhodospirillales bacterium]